MEQSILLSTKKILGVGPDDASFDPDIIIHINSAFSTLTQLGLGETDGFMIEDNEAEWADFEPETPIMNAVKTYVYLKTRLVFDPPQTGFVLAALEKQLDEHVWRLSTMREETEWVDPDPPLVVVDDG